MNVALFSLCLILSAISTLAIEFWNVPVDDDSFNMDWAVNFTQPSYGAVNVHNATTPMCPPNGYSSNGCFEFVPPVRTTATVYTSGFMHIYLEYTIITAGLIDGEGCYIFADDGTQRAQVDSIEYGDPEDGDPNGKFNGYDLANFFGFDPTPSEITIELYAKTPNLDETYAQCFFSNLVLGGEPIISTTQFDTTTTTTSPGLTTLHDFPLNSVPDDQWTVQSLNDSGTVIEHFFDNYCSNLMNNYCWELTPSSVVEIQLDITGQIIFFIDFFIAKVGFGDGYCEFNFENYDSRTISTDDSQILTLELMGYTNDYVRIILSAIGTPTFHCEFADIIIRGIWQNIPSYEPTPSPDSQQTGFEVEPMDQVYCPWVVAGDGAPELVGSEFCNAAFDETYEGDELITVAYSYTWQCLGHRQIRYTRFTDNKCMNYEIETDLGYDDHCPQCGYTSATFNDEPLSFDCSNINDYGTNNCNYADWGRSTGCYPNGTLLHDGLQTQHVITDTCFMMSESTSLMAQCHESDDTFYLQFFSNDRYCEGFPSTGSFSYSCQADNAADISCHYGDIPDDNNNGGGDDSWPVDTVYCPYISGQDGPASVFGPNLCQGQYGRDNRTGLVQEQGVTFECVGYGLIRYTNYSDALCTNPLGSEIAGNGEHCKGCGYIDVGDPFNFRFDCSWYGEYDETACNRVDLAIGTQCNGDGTTLNMEEQFQTMHILTDVCFSNGDSSHMITCEGDTINVMSYNDWDCGYPNENKSFAIVQNCEEQEGVEGLAEFTCVDGDIPDNNGNDDEGESGSDVYPIDNVYCPYISGFDGPPSVIGPNLCQGRQEKDNRTGLVREEGITFECVDYGLMRYTNYSDALCTNPSGSEIVGNSEHCEGCGGIEVNDPLNLRFDCSWYGVYDETACNRVDLMVSPECNDDGTTLNTEDDFMTWHILTDVCFSNGDSSHMITCEGDTITVMKYEDPYCYFTNENRSEVIVEGCEFQEGVEGVSEFTCVDGDIPDLPQEDTYVYCPWAMDHSIGIAQLTDRCSQNPDYDSSQSYMYECVDYGALRFTLFTVDDCSADAIDWTLTFGQEGEHCAECGPIVVEDMNMTFDCSYYDQYDETNCDTIALRMNEGCSPDATTPKVDVGIAAGVCAPMDSMFITFTCEDSGNGPQMNAYYDSECNTLAMSQDWITPGCDNGTETFVTCTDGSIPDNSGGDDGPSYPNDDIFCPWFSTDDDSMGKPFGFCETDIKDVYDNGQDMFVAEYHECVDDQTMVRRVFVDTKPITCSGQPNVTQTIGSGINMGRRRRLAINTTDPTVFPTSTPTVFPTKTPTGFPTKTPTGFPTKTPTGFPTKTPT
eukprot:439961_1